MGSLIVRFPDGSREFRYPEKGVSEGDVFWHDGRRYRVLTVAGVDGRQTATVELAGDGAGGTAAEQDGIVLAPIEA